MPTLELPSGESVTPEDTFMYEGYPYRFRPAGDDETTAFYLTPLYWGGGEMDIPFPDREVLVDQWGKESQGVLTPDEWRTWLSNARVDDRFDEPELEALAEELGGRTPGLFTRVRRLLGL
jgi:hypothetical protein